MMGQSYLLVAFFLFLMLELNNKILKVKHIYKWVYTASIQSFLKKTLREFLTNVQIIYWGSQNHYCFKSHVFCHLVIFKRPQSEHLFI